MKHNSTEQTTPDASLTQENAKENLNKNYRLIERIEVENTPFTILKNNEKNNCFLAMGDYRLTPEMKTEEEIHQWIKDNHWLLITTIASIAAEKVYQMQIKLQTTGTING